MLVATLVLGKQGRVVPHLGEDQGKNAHDLLQASQRAWWGNQEARGV